MEDHFPSAPVVAKRGHRLRLSRQSAGITKRIKKSSKRHRPLNTPIIPLGTRTVNRKKQRTQCSVFVAQRHGAHASCVLSFASSRNSHLAPPSAPLHPPRGAWALLPATSAQAKPRPPPPRTVLITLRVMPSAPNKPRPPPGLVPERSAETPLRPIRPLAQSPRGARRLLSASSAPTPPRPPPCTSNGARNSHSAAGRQTSESRASKAPSPTTTREPHPTPSKNFHTARDQKTAEKTSF